MKATRIMELKGVEEPERIRLLLEHEKVVAERIKSGSTALSIFIPLLIATLTIAYNMQGAARRANVDFELKAAEIVMTAESPAAAVNKAKVLVALFPDRLSPRFVEVFESMYGEN
jgi:hypothetical protein